MNTADPVETQAQQGPPPPSTARTARTEAPRRSPTPRPATPRARRRRRRPRRRRRCRRGSRAAPPPGRRAPGSGSGACRRRGRRGARRRSPTSRTKGIQGAGRGAPPALRAQRCAAWRRLTPGGPCTGAAPPKWQSLRAAGIGVCAGRRRGPAPGLARCGERGRAPPCCSRDLRAPARLFWRCGATAGGPAAAIWRGRTCVVLLRPGPGRAICPAVGARALERRPCTLPTAACRSARYPHAPGCALCLCADGTHPALVVRALSAACRPCAGAQQGDVRMRLEMHKRRKLAERWTKVSRTWTEAVEFAWPTPEMLHGVIFTRPWIDFGASAQRHTRRREIPSDTREQVVRRVCR